MSEVEGQIFGLCFLDLVEESFIEWDRDLRRNVLDPLGDDKANSILGVEKIAQPLLSAALRNADQVLLDLRGQRGLRLSETNDGADSKDMPLIEHVLFLVLVGLSNYGTDVALLNDKIRQISKIDVLPSLEHFELKNKGRLKH